eukprot:TRINITY_DN31191_c0_g1_i1.p1 TRINITY_DN31191_c0_g1~~TRINITY_DN31191_c0_g1_i1.p1  ORF type:complete len:587 (-),score=100.20 TRINITY_DN31191_c0_g1_i1:108-1868(-)
MQPCLLLCLLVLATRSHDDQTESEHDDDDLLRPGCLDASPSVQLLQRGLHLTRASPAREPDAEHGRADSPMDGSLRSLAFLLEDCSGVDCMKRYVDAPDSAYAWRDTSLRLHGERWTGAVLHLTSQRWLSEQVKPGVWNHTLVVISPHGSEQDSGSDWCTLYVALGFYGSPGTPAEAVRETDPDLVAAAAIAVSSGAPAAVLFNVPAEFLTFETDFPATAKIEDAELAKSWALFGGIGRAGMQKPWKPEPKLLLELPMTKAVVRAMDALTEFSVSRPPQALPLLRPLTRFALVGTSKRGHVCWHAAAVDSRVGAIVPLVRTLNLRAFIALTKRTLGGLPMAAHDYQDWQLFSGFLDTPMGSWFLNITDAYTFLDRFAYLPKYSIMASNDEFFMPDNTRLWWQSVPGPKWNLMVPNSPHIVGGVQVEALAPTMSAFLVDAMSPRDGVALPALSWSIDATSGAISAQLPLTGPAPTKVRLWKATTCDNHRRDFRLHNKDQGEACSKCGALHSTSGSCENRKVSFSSTPLPEIREGTRRWLAEVPAPDDGRWAAFFVDFTWASGLVLSTEVSVVPDTVPFPDGNRSDLV